MSYEFIEVSTSDHVTTVTIDRPQVLNALHPYAVREMEKAFDTFQDDDEQWVAILTGAGDRAFCAGNDLKFQAGHGPEHVRKLRRGLKGGFGGITRRTGCFKPIIAAVNGFALGGGFELALACDIIVAAEHATFGLPEPRVGLLAAAGGAHRLPRYIPYHAAMAVLLAGKRLSAAEAHSYGLVNEVVAGDALMEAARRWGRRDPQGCAPLGAGIEGSGDPRHGHAARTRARLDVSHHATDVRVGGSGRRSARLRRETPATLEGAVNGVTPRRDEIPRRTLKCHTTDEDGSGG